MNKLGFYIENSTVPGLRDALRQVKPPTILFHAGDRTLLQEIRRDISPDSFIIGRFMASTQEQDQWLDSSDPDAAGAAYADRILNYDFQYATERVNSHLLVDAWMTLNESLRGPASFENYAVDDQFRRRAANLDRFQVAMRNRLLPQGIETVAFNFAAGNYTRPEHYLDWFPRTLESFRYLGFHEYGWPTLDPRPGTATGALYYKTCLDGIRRQYGNRHIAIITEAGLARMYKYPTGPAGDVGWLYPDDTISQEQYWETLQWYNDQLCRDSQVRGACLFEVGHAGKWTSFRHLGQDNQDRPITLISRIAGLRETVLVEPVNRMKIEDFPRPPDDNGRGVHWSGSVYHPKGSELDTWIAELQALKIKWVKLMDDCGGSSLELCQRLLAAGIMPVVRLFKERPNPAGVGGRGIEAAQALVKAGVRYFETNNEPDLPDEWQESAMPNNWLDIVVDGFISDADAILGMGGLLGFPAMGVPDNMARIDKVVARGRRDLFERGCWVALHNYSLNRPPEHPDDPINRAGQQLTQEEYDRLGPWAWSLQTRDEINALRSAEKKPTQTALEAPGSFRGYELAGKRIFDALGFYVPVISTEGGPVVGAFWDRRYNKTVPQQQMEWQVEIVRRMQRNETPDWYFTMCTWMIAARRLGDWNYAWEQMSWYTDAWNEQFGLQGRLPVVDALKALPSVSRLKPQGRGSLRGQVRRESGEPLGCVRLSLDTAGQAAQALTTEVGGAFAFEGLAAGLYTLNVVTAGPVAAITLGEGENKTIDVTVRGTGSASAISGQVLTAEGAPQAAAAVTLHMLTDGAAQTVGSATAAADGRFTFERLTAGAYRAQLGQGRSGTLTLDGWSIVTTELRLPAPPGFRYVVASTKAVPDGTRRLYGRVLDVQGNGINGVKVQMSWSGAAPTGGFPTTTSGQDPYKPAGNFEFIASPGEFRLVVVQGDWPSDATPSLNTSSVAGQTGNSFAWEVIFRRAPTVQAASIVRGHITQPPPAATTVLTGSALADGPRSTPLDANGNFRFDALPAGDDYALTLSGIAPLGGTFALDGSNEVVRDLALTAALHGTVSGATSGTSIELAMLKPLNWQRTRAADAGGAFGFEGLPPGQYRLSIDAREVAAVTLAEGQQMDMPTIVLTQPGQRAVRGQAKRVSGALLPAARILLLQAGRVIGETSTDSLGAFAFEGLNPGFYTVSLADFNITGDVLLQTDEDARVTLVAPNLVIPPTTKLFEEYLLLERAGATHAQLRLRILPEYLAAHPATAVGYSADEARLATRVIILADADAISAEVEESLRAAGCIVERVAGDLYAQAAGLS